MSKCTVVMTTGEICGRWVWEGWNTAAPRCRIHCAAAVAARAARVEKRRRRKAESAAYVQLVERAKQVEQAKKDAVLLVCDAGRQGSVDAAWMQRARDVATILGDDGEGGGA